MNERLTSVLGNVASGFSLRTGARIYLVLLPNDMLLWIQSDMNEGSVLFCGPRTDPDIAQAMTGDRFPCS